VDICPGWVDAPPTSDTGIYVVGSADEQKSDSKARSAALSNAGSMASRSVGVNVNVRPQEWCVTPDNSKRRPRYNARGLGFVSNDDIVAAKEQARIAAEREQARRDELARLAAEQQAKLLEQQQANPGGGTTGGTTGGGDDSGGTGGDDSGGGFDEPTDPG